MKIVGVFCVRLPTRSVSFEVALFVAISTRSVSEGISYVARDVFPLASLAHASGWENTWEIAISTAPERERVATH
jgi:hypothetical protein